LVRGTNHWFEMSTQYRHTTAAKDRVSWNQLIAYGMGGLIPIALFNIAGQLMGLLGNISLGLSAFWLGTIMIFPRLWDAISDPVMGHITDNTRTRWGRRRPYILIGGISVALSFVAMWWVPRGEWIRTLFPSEVAYNWFQLAFILAGLLVFFTACTVFEIPHGALGMEMSADYHERTRLFSAKSFLGNLFAMGTPWLIFLAGLEVFRGPGGDLTDGMRFVSMIIAAALIPLAYWWFLSLREPGFAVAREQKKTAFWKDMRNTISNRTFLSLVMIIFTLAMGFNFVALFNYYITIFYLYGGDAVAAGRLLGINGTVWAVTAIIAVVPLNWLSRRWGKNKTLLFAILLMCAAQLSKIYCYNPRLPYLILIPTVLLSSGMLMFFTLGSSMVGDVCDEDDLKTGTRSEGSYYSVYWWFIKLGTAFASFVTGALLVFTSFDEQQNVIVDSLTGSIATIQSEAELWTADSVHDDAQINRLESQVKGLDKQVKLLDEHRKDFDKQMANTIALVSKLKRHWSERARQNPDQAGHIAQLVNDLDAIDSMAQRMKAQSAGAAPPPSELLGKTRQMLQLASRLKLQAPKTLLRLRIVEIGLPLLLSIVSILLTLRYPLTEARCYEIKETLEKRRAERGF
jgi:glycoside/pentoside/hexuronide:cation symporter, GPH family